MCLALLMLLVPLTHAQAGPSILLSDFEQGPVGWVTNDYLKYSGQSQDTPLVSIEASSEAHSGSGGARITFHPGQGWAGAYIPLASVRDRLTDAQVDEFAFWMKGDGQDVEVTVHIQAWSDEHVPSFWGVPVSLRDTQWHQVVIPLAQFQAANPGVPLRLPFLHAFQFDAGGEIGPASLWIDDLVARAAHGQGRAFAAGPPWLEAKLKALPPAHGLPRWGMWGFVPLTPEGLAASRRLGLQFGSNDDTRLQQQLAFVEGLVSNDCPGRPGPEVLAGLGFGDEDLDQDAEGHPMGEGVRSAVFAPQVLDRFCRYVGEAVVGFGAGCLASTVEPDRSVRATPGMGGLLKGHLPTEGLPERLEAKVGRGRVVLFRNPTVDGPFLHEAAPLLEAEAARAGVRRWCRADAAQDINLMCAGREAHSGKHPFVVDLTRSVRNEPPEAEANFWTNRSFELSFDPSLRGDAVLAGLTDSFKRCRGGRAEFDPASHILRVRFRLPGKLALVFGDAQTVAGRETP